MPMGGYDASYNAWCSPTSAANQLGHLVDSGLLTTPPHVDDGFIAGHERPIATPASTIGYSLCYSLFQRMEYSKYS